MLRGTPREATDVFAWPACSAFLKKQQQQQRSLIFPCSHGLPMSYTFTRIYNEADTCCSSEQLEGALKERCAEVPRLLVHKPPETYYCSFDLNVTSAACCGGLKKKKEDWYPPFSDAVNNTWRVETRCLDIQAAALDHFLGCSPPIKQLSSTRKCEQRQRKWLSSMSSFHFLLPRVSAKRLAAAAADK